MKTSARVILYFSELVSTKFCSIRKVTIMNPFNTPSFALQLTAYERSNVLSWSSSKAEFCSKMQKCLQLTAGPQHYLKCFETSALAEVFLHWSGHFTHDFCVSSLRRLCHKLLAVPPQLFKLSVPVPGPNTFTIQNVTILFLICLSTSILLRRRRKALANAVMKCCVWLR